MDNPILTGCSRKRKYKRLKYLLGTAALSLMLLFGLANRGLLQDTLLAQIPRKNLSWHTSRCTAENPGMLLGENILCGEAGAVTLETPEGDVLWRLETSFQRPVCTVAASYGVVYEPGEPQLLFLSESGHRWVTVSAGVFAAALSEHGELAVITAGSGYQTTLLQYNDRGAVTAEHGFPAEAALMPVYVGNTLVYCTLSPEGNWALQLGENKVMLDAELVYDIKPMPEGVALWSSDGIDLFSQTGDTLATYACPGEEILAWDADRVAVLCLWSTEGCHLVRLSPRGTMEESSWEQEMPRQISLCGNTTCLLTGEKLYFVNPSLEITEQTCHGASAAWARAIHGGAYLFGNGEKMRYICN